MILDATCCRFKAQTFFFFWIFESRCLLKSKLKLKLKLVGVDLEKRGAAVATSVVNIHFRLERACKLHDQTFQSQQTGFLPPAISNLPFPTVFLSFPLSVPAILMKSQHFL